MLYTQFRYQRFFGSRSNSKPQGFQGNFYTANDTKNHNIKMKKASTGQCIEHGRVCPNLE